MAENEFRGARAKPLLFTVLVGLLLWFSPHPEALGEEGWHLFSLFVATIIGVISRPLPVGPVVLIGLTMAGMTELLSADQLFVAFGKYQIWLIALAFFLAHGLIKTGLAERISYYFLRLLGKSLLGVAYGISFGELVMAPFIPSLAARAGGMVFPIMKALAHDFEAAYSEKAIPRLKGFLALSAFQGSAITSGMFLTAMAANPLMLDAAATHGVSVTWTQWAVAASVPGLVSLLVMPLVLITIMRPEVRKTPSAQRLAKERLARLGPMSGDEKTMAMVLGVVLFLWVIGPWVGLASVVAALFGLSLLLILGVLSWKDCLEQTQAWDTVFWLAGLVAMGTRLNELGFFDWLGNVIESGVGDLPWQSGFLLLALVYFYSHYLFASNTAHILAMYGAFLATAIHIGTPPLLAVLVLAFFSNLFGGLTHYSNSPAPIFYGARFVSLQRWWGVGFICSIINITIWLVIGGLWWKALGIW